MARAQGVRAQMGNLLIVRSAYRSSEHNRAVGGAARSKRMEGAAFDNAMSNHDSVAFRCGSAGELSTTDSNGHPGIGYDALHVPAVSQPCSPEDRRTIPPRDRSPRVTSTIRRRPERGLQPPDSAPRRASR